MRYGRLGDIHGIHYLVNAQPAAATQRHDFLASIVCQSFAKFNRIEVPDFQIDNLLYNIISIFINMSRPNLMLVYAEPASAKPARRVICAHEQLSTPHRFLPSPGSRYAPPPARN